MKKDKDGPDYTDSNSVKKQEFSFSTDTAPMIEEGP